MIKKTYSKLLWYFDRTFGNSKKWFWQFCWVFGFLSVAVLFFTILGNWFFPESTDDVLQNKQELVVPAPIASDSVYGCATLKSMGLSYSASPAIGQSDSVPIIPISKNDKLTITQKTIGMILKSNGITEKSAMPFEWQVLLVFVGTFLVSGFVITYLGNLLRNRLEAFKNGNVRYYFTGHILFLGGSKMICPMIKELYKKQEYRKRDFVILSTDEPGEIRRQIYGALSDTEKKSLKITVLRGLRDEKESLESVHVDKASRIYIVGENPNDPEHDSTNMACWNLAKELCSNRKGIPCFLMFNRASSAYIFRHKEEADGDSCLDTTIVNRLESVAQRVLVHNGDENKFFPALDRDGIRKDKDHDRTVHFVLYGTTAISYALATTAAHLCHFPNFVIRDDNGTWGENKERRTRITFITPKMKDEMAYLTSHLNNLFRLSKVNFIDENGKKHEDIYNISKDEVFGDFLDIEWDFVDGNIADGRIRELLLDYYQKNQKGETYLTLAMCQKEADKNIAAALYLPSEFHTIEYKDEEKTEVDFVKTIPILVFQPESEEMLKTANHEIAMFKNIFPFGSVKESYDPSIRMRISEGKRIGYIYNRGEDYAFMTSDQEELDRQWRNMKYADQMSNIYSASHIGVKLRSVGNRSQLTEEEIQLLAVTEHNRWNVEKLLMGFEALPKLVRDKQVDAEGLKELKKRKKQFKHYCIEPYCELNEADKKYDILIVKNLGDII